MASAFVPEGTHAPNITHFDCQISLECSLTPESRRDGIYVEEKVENKKAP